MKARCICLALGTVGVVLPILPTTPFFLVTAYCFARSSEKLNNWFKGTKLYKKHLDSTPDLLLAFCEDD
ncbi:MAG: YbaN family protein [Lachnospiraceae bacterium]|nr:YbaN family protein [Lachnospiraceae bacterium]